MREDPFVESTARRVLGLLLETPPPDRIARALALCEGEPRTLARVRELLDASEDPGVDLAALSAEVAQLAETRECVVSGAFVGGFEIVRFVGRGGMGEVYEAVQPEPRRRVALKVMRGERLSDELRRRFVDEARVLARLRHPAIAQVFAAGTHVEQTPLGQRELPWLAMEFVEDARDVVAFAREQGLDLAARARLAARFARAVQHGHERGVVHRDLKPANLLVGSDGEPKVIDFGIARALGEDAEDATRATRAGDILGTIGYIAPEVLRGEVDAPDTRADVYALGVVLYELVLGRPPVDLAGCGVAEGARRVAERAPLRPRSIEPAIDADFESVLLQAVASEPARRYATAGLLAEDLERWLAREPVLARPPGRLHRVALFARRNPLLSAALATLLVVLCTAAAGGAKLSIDRGRALDEALASRDGFLSFHDIVIGELFVELGRLGSTASRVRIVSATSAELATLGERSGSDPRILRALAETHLRLGDVLGGSDSFHVGDLDGAAREYGHAAALLARLRVAGEADDDLDLLEAKLLHRGKNTGALPGEPDHLALQARALELLEPLAARRPEHVPTQLLLAEALQHSTVAHEDFALLQARHDRGVEILRRLLDAHPDDAEVASQLAVFLCMQSTLTAVLGDDEASLAGLREAVALLEPLVAADPGARPFRFNLGYVERHLAQIIGSMQRHDETVEHASRALEVLEPLAAEDPTNARFAIEALQVRKIRGRSRLALAKAAPEVEAADALFADSRADLEHCLDELSWIEQIYADDFALQQARTEIEKNLERLEELGR